jgi:hypothetical protein
MPIFIRFDGLNETARELPQISENLRKPVILGLSQVAYDSAQRGAARHNKTGALVQSLFNRAIPEGRQVGHDAQRAPHAIFVNFGTKPHVIKPKTKNALRWSAGGRFHFARIVHHPGYIGDNYIFAAADEAVRQFERIVDAALKETT